MKTLQFAPYPAVSIRTYAFQSLTTVILLVTALSVAAAQPSLTIRRQIVNWPVVETYFAVECNGHATRLADTSMLTVTENGIAKPFSLLCADPSYRCPMSSALVLDGGIRMGGVFTQTTIAATHAFINRMDNLADQSAILWFNDSTTLRQGMTRDTALLHAAVTALPAAGGYKMWDGVFAGLSEMAAHPAIACRALIVLTAGDDLNSTHTPQEVVLFANANHIRLFMIGLGTTVNPSILQGISDLTGGESYLLSAPTIPLLTTIYDEISTSIHQGFNECVAAYTSSCLDGTPRTVTLRVTRLCTPNDTVSASRSFIPLRDTTTFADFHVNVGSVNAAADADIAVPVTTPDTLSGVTFNPAAFDVTFDTTMIEFKKLETAGMLLDGLPLTVTQDSSGLHVAAASGTVITGPGTLFTLKFRTRDLVGTDSTVSTVGLANWAFVAGCLLPSTTDGTLKIARRASELQAYVYPPFVLHWVDTLSKYVPDTVHVSAEIVNRGSRTAFHAAALLEYDTLLAVIDSATAVLQETVPSTIAPGATATASWNLVLGARLPGDSLRVCALPVEGGHAWPGDCAWATSATVPPVIALGPVSFCFGDSTKLMAYPGLSDLLWSNGDSGRVIVVRQSGSYSYSGRTPDSVLVTSQELQITAHPLPVPVITVLRGPSVCAGDSVVLQAPEGYLSYHWSSGETVRSITVRATGTRSVVVQDSNGCTGSSMPISVQVHALPTPVISGSTSVCQHDTTVYSTPAVAGHAYDWSVSGGALISGQGTRAITVSWADTTQGRISLTETDTATTCASAVQKDVVVIPFTRPVITPSGTIHACTGDTVRLDAGAGYATYRWSAKDTLRRLVVTRSGVFAVTASVEGGCSAVSDSVRVLFDVKPAPQITGPSTVCYDSRTTHSVTNVPGHVYQWTVQGGVITAGNGTAWIEVHWATPGIGLLMVTQTNGTCVSIDSQLVQITSIVQPVIKASGPTSFCSGGSVTLDAGAGYTSYQWSNGARTRTINVATTGVYTVYVESAAGCSGTSLPVQVTANPKPVTPVISRNINVLMCTPAYRYQWNLSGTPIPGETNQYLELKQSGVYSVTITDTNGCTATSLPYSATIVSVQTPARPALDLSVYPEPNDGRISVRLTNTQRTDLLLTVHDLLGRERMRLRDIPASDTWTRDVDLTALPAGTYVLTVHAGAVQRSVRIVRR